MGFLLVVILSLLILVLFGRKPGVTLRDVEKGTKEDLVEIEHEVVRDVVEEVEELSIHISFHKEVTDTDSITSK